MSVKLKGGKPASSEDFEALEAHLGESVLEPFRRFVLANDGAKPEGNIFAANRNVGVTGFIPVREIWDKRRFLVDRLPPRAFPVAWDDCGNFVVIDQDEGGAVYFWDHELHDPLTRLADDWDLFLAGLEPFDPDSVEVPPGSVLTVVDFETYQHLKELDRKR
jgi:hypothetical protein